MLDLTVHWSSVSGNHGPSNLIPFFLSLTSKSLNENKLDSNHLFSVKLYTIVDTVWVDGGCFYTLIFVSKLYQTGAKQKKMNLLF